MKLIVVVDPGVYVQGMAFVGDSTHQEVVDYLNGIQNEEDPFFVPQEMERAFNALSRSEKKTLREDIDRARGLICETNSDGRRLIVCHTENDYNRHFNRIDIMIRGGGTA